MNTYLVYIHNLQALLNTLSQQNKIKQHVTFQNDQSVNVHQNYFVFYKFIFIYVRKLCMYLNSNLKIVKQ